MNAGNADGVVSLLNAEQPHHLLSTMTHTSPPNEFLFFPLTAECKCPSSSLQNRVWVAFDATARVYMQAPQYFPKCAANPCKVPWMFSPPMLHLNKSVIR